MKYIPDMMVHPIERARPIVDGVKTHPAVLQNEKNIQEEKERLERIQKNCNAIRATVPLLWKSLEEDLIAAYFVALLASKQSPVESAATGMHPEYYALCQAYLKGKTEALESIFEQLKIDPPKAPDHKPVEEKSFFKKLVDRFFK